MAEPDDGLTWIEWYCSQLGNEFLCEVDPSFIEDAFNLYGLKSIIPHFRDCLELLLDAADGDSEESDWTGDLADTAAKLYGLIHARYILTTRGQALMLERYVAGEFGVCPRYHCGAQHVLPVGLSDNTGHSTVKLFCPKCQDVYSTPLSALDGAYFGTTFPHMLMLTKPRWLPKPPTTSYVATIYGFRVLGRAGSRARVTIAQDGSLVPIEASAAAASPAAGAMLAGGTAAAPVVAAAGATSNKRAGVNRATSPAKKPGSRNGTPARASKKRREERRK